MTTYWTGQNFTVRPDSGVPYAWNSPTSLATGTYSVDIGVFDSTWRQLLLERIGGFDHRPLTDRV